MSLLEKINNLTWWNEISKLKNILRELAASMGAIPEEDKVYYAYIGKNGVTIDTNIFKNNIGDIIWNAEDVGLIKGTLVGAFSPTSTVIYPFNPEPQTNIIWLPIRAYNPSTEEGYLTTIIENDAIYIYTIDNTGTPADFDTLFGTTKYPIKIEVFN